jgi:hypothetical protein
MPGSGPRVQTSTRPPAKQPDSHPGGLPERPFKYPRRDFFRKQDLPKRRGRSSWACPSSPAYRPIPEVAARAYQRLAMPAKQYRAPPINDTKLAHRTPRSRAALRVARAADTLHVVRHAPLESAMGAASARRVRERVASAFRDKKWALCFKVIRSREHREERRHGALAKAGTDWRRGYLERRNAALRRSDRDRLDDVLRMAAVGPHERAEAAVRGTISRARRSSCALPRTLPHAPPGPAPGRSVGPAARDASGRTVAPFEAEMWRRLEASGGAERGERGSRRGRPKTPRDHALASFAPSHAARRRRSPVDQRLVRTAHERGNRTTRRRKAARAPAPRARPTLSCAV